MAENVQTEAPVQEQVVANGETFKEVLKTLMASGKCKRFNGLRIKNVNFSEEDNYTRVSFTVASKVPGYVSKDNGVTFTLGETSTIFSSTYALAGMLKEDEEKSWMANALAENPKALNLIMNGGTIDIIQQSVAEGEPYHNPFTTKEDVEDTVFDHDTIINYIVGFELGKTGARFADVLAVKMMGF